MRSVWVGLLSLSLAACTGDAGGEAPERITTKNMKCKSCGAHPRSECAYQGRGACPDGEGICAVVTPCDPECCQVKPEEAMDKTALLHEGTVIERRDEDGQWQPWKTLSKEQPPLLVRVVKLTQGRARIRLIVNPPAECGVVGRIEPDPDLDLSVDTSVLGRVEEACAMATFPGGKR